MFWYGIMFVIGLCSALACPQEILRENLFFLEAITITAFLASLLLPFAAFSQTEKWHAWCVQYAPIPMIGVMSVGLYHPGENLWHILKLNAPLYIVLISAIMVHLGYWMSGIHSRAFRFRQFKLGYATANPHTAAAIARLNIARLQHIADSLIVALANGEQLPAASLEYLTEQEKKLLPKEFSPQ